jgi:hypothetical protein
MALSNIFREPRREITESLAGILLVGIFLFVDWQFACWFQGAIMPRDNFFRFIGMLIGLIATVACIGMAFFTHFVGEEICDALANRGLELRPKQRH